LADALRQHIGAAVRTAPGFLQSMARQDDEYEVALGFFRRFAVEREDLAHRGEVNLKLGALTPMIDAVRLLALRAGVEEASTLARLADLQARSVLSRDEADRLAAGYADLADMLLRRQIQDIRSGRQPSAFVPPEALTARERDGLEEALRSIRDLRTGVRLELLGQAF
jgi:CBS domain-containing protein